MVPNYANKNWTTVILELTQFIQIFMRNDEKLLSI